jgi:glycosyltransferase involved in cell wall biosynthesis
MKFQPPSSISVVIATIGNRASINGLIDSLFDQSISIGEIIIVVPRKKRSDFNKVFERNHESVRILFTPYAGQVRQRVFGFRYCSSNTVLQIDDDVIFPNESFLARLATHLADRQNETDTRSVCVGPFMNVLNPSLVSKFRQITERCFGGIRTPKISLFGGGSYPRIPINNLESVYGPTIEAEWLPGGILLSDISALSLKNYYPFHGRAEGEDIIDSVLKRRMGVKLFVCLETRIDISKDPLEFESSNLKKQLTISIYINKLLGRKLYWAPLIKYLLKRTFYDLGKYFWRVR